MKTGPWSEDEVAQATRMRRERMSASSIGRVLKRSRNSVIAALWRRGEPGVLSLPRFDVAKDEPTSAASPPRRFSFEDAHV